VAAVIEDAYHTLLMKGRHPLAVLNIGISPGVVDVNIHPTKSEVKFRDTARVLGTLGRAVRAALLASGAQIWDDEWAANEPLQVAQRRFELRRIGDWQDERERGAGAMLSRAGQLGAAPAALWPAPQPDQQQTPAAEQSGQAGLSAQLRVIGQAAQAYIVAETPAGIYLIDQHAAHERVLYERFAKQHVEGALERQELPAPLTIELAQEAHDRLLGQREALATLGFAIEDFGMALRVRAHPIGFPQQRIAAALAELATQLAHADGSPSAWPHTALAVLACHAALRSGQSMAAADMQVLLGELARCAAPDICPHGRPTLILLGSAQLERQLGHAR
jgi:DNA mismatch repair protein MutL